MSIAVHLKSTNGEGWLILDSLPRFIKRGLEIKDAAELYNRHGHIVKATVNVSQSEFRRYASGRFLNG